MTPAQPESPPPPKRGWKARLYRLWREVRPILAVVLVLCTIRSAAADWYSVPTGSMKPTILEGERIFVNKTAYDLRFPFTDWTVCQTGEPRRGDVVVFYSPQDGTRLVKRVVGLPDDTVEMRDNRLWINGAPLAYESLAPAAGDAMSESDRAGRRFACEHLGAHRHPVMTTPARPAARSFAPVTVPPNQYLVLGDNRDESNDSRYIGFIPREKICGRALAVVISGDPKQWYWPRWRRFLTALP